METETMISSRMINSKFEIPTLHHNASVDVKYDSHFPTLTIRIKYWKDENISSVGKYCQQKEHCFVSFFQRIIFFEKFSSLSECWEHVLASVTP